MRRVGLAVTVAAGVVLASATAGWAAPTPTPSGPAIPVPAAVKPATVCTVTAGGKGAVAITGLVATKTGYAVVDGDNPEWGTYLVRLNSKCQRVGGTQTYPGGGAHDPQDLQIDKAGTLWIADIGDTGTPPNRSTIAIWKVSSTSSMTLYHFQYPDGAHNAAAMVLDGDGRPIFITRNGNGPATVYEPAAGALKSGTTPLTKVGTFASEQTGTANKLGLLGQTWVTGGAVSPDGSRVVVRTGTDAYEFDVKNGDVAGAITKGKPRITPMPDEEDGEAIAYTADGSSFLTISNTTNATPILKYAPAKAIATAGGKSAAVAGPKKPSALRAWFNKLSLGDLELILGAVALFGAILVTIGILGIRDSRRKQRAAAASRDKAGGGNVARAGTAAVSGDGVYGAAGAGGVYGAPPGGPGGPPAGGGVYGAPGGPNGAAGGVYGGPGGGSGGAGGVYGAPPAGGGGVYGAPNAAPGGGVYGGASRDPEPHGYDPYASSHPGDYPGGGGSPYGGDPYAQQDGPRPPGGQYSGGQYGGQPGQHPGGQQAGGQYPGGGHDPAAYDPGPYDPGPYDPSAYDPGPYDPSAYDPGPYGGEQAPGDDRRPRPPRPGEYGHRNG